MAYIHTLQIECWFPPRNFLSAYFHTLVVVVSFLMVLLIRYQGANLKSLNACSISERDRLTVEKCGVNSSGRASFL